MFSEGSESRIKLRKVGGGMFGWQMGFQAPLFRPDNGFELARKRVVVGLRSLES